MKIFKGGRQRPADYIAICKNIADSYTSGTPHGVQKDAIQNAVDAGKGRDAVSVRFELIENANGFFVTITDSNTSGLTGPVLRDVEDYDKELPEDYHWTRFKAFAFTKEDPNAIGARGQGQFCLSPCVQLLHHVLRHAAKESKGPGPFNASYS